MHPLMTPRCHEVLCAMLAAEEADDFEGAEIVQDGRHCWRGFDRISPRTVLRLLQLALLRHNNDGGCDHYTLNEEGRAMARDRDYVPLIDTALRAYARSLSSLPLRVSRR